MKKKTGGLRSTIQLSLGEYVETLSSLVYEHYQRAMSDEALFSSLALSEQEQTQFSVEYATVLLVIASLAFKAKPKLTEEKYLRRIQARTAEATFQKLLQDGDEETIQACVGLYRQKMEVFSQICKRIYSKEAALRQQDIVGFSRMLIGQLRPGAEEANLAAIQRAGICLSEATDTFIALVTSTVQDSVRLDGKPTFAVLK